MTKDKMAKALSDFCKEHKVETMDLITYKSHGNDVPVNQICEIMSDDDE